MEVVKTEVPKRRGLENDHGGQTETQAAGLQEMMCSMKEALKRQPATIKQLSVRRNDLELWIKTNVEHIVRACANNMETCEK